MADNMTAEQHREAARAARQEAADSFERCDTDGYLSQWASGLSAREHDAKALLAEEGGTSTFTALFLNGELASTHNGWGQYGEWWRLNDEAAAQYGKQFFSPSKAKNGVERDRAKGFTYGTVRVNAYVDIRGNMTTAYVGIFPVVEDLRSGNFEVVATDGDRRDYQPEEA